VVKGGLEGSSTASKTSPLDIPSALEGAGGSARKSLLLGEKKQDQDSAYGETPRSYKDGTRPCQASGGTGARGIVSLLGKERSYQEGENERTFSKGLYENLVDMVKRKEVRSDHCQEKGGGRSRLEHDKSREDTVSIWGDSCLSFRGMLMG